MSYIQLGEPAQFPIPVFRLDCTAANCPLPTLADCRTALRQATADAIRLCVTAANKLDARDPDTVRHFRRIFGHDPSRPVPWANNQPSGDTVAHRLRKVAEALHGRVVHFGCNCPGAPAGRNAQTNAAVNPNLINLCARFWNRVATPTLSNRSFRAGVILHEMLHLLYSQFFHHAGHPSGDPERHRDNSHCYEAFVLLANGLNPEADDLNACAARPF
ncbi:MAG TPA: hypothetical protein VIG25_04805 [Pyrinomonadaceae bacterium]|jgi:hypothetical protein